MFFPFLKIPKIKITKLKISSHAHPPPQSSVQPSLFALSSAFRQVVPAASSRGVDLSVIISADDIPADRTRARSLHARVRSLSQKLCPEAREQEGLRGPTNARSPSPDPPPPSMRSLFGLRGQPVLRGPVLQRKDVGAHCVEPRNAEERRTDGDHIEALGRAWRVVDGTL